MVAFRLFAEPLLFMYNTMFGMNGAVIPQLMLRKVCLRENPYNKTRCIDKENTSIDANQIALSWWFYTVQSVQIVSIFTTLVFGLVSDSVGYRKCLLCIPFIDTLAQLGCLINVYFIDAHPGFLMLACLLQSLYGEQQGVSSLCFAATAYMTKNKVEHRTQLMTFVELGGLLALSIAGLLAGELLHAFGFVSIFILNIGINVVALFYVYCYLRPSDEEATISSEAVHLIGEDTEIHDLDIECYNEEKKACDEETNKDNVNTGKESSSICTKFQYIKDVIKFMQGKPVLIAILLASIFYGLGYYGEYTVEVFYLKNKPFVLSELYIGYYQGLQSLIRFICTAILIQLSFHLFHCNDYLLMITGVTSEMTALVLIGTSQSILAVFLSTLASFASPIVFSTTRSVITKNVANNKYGITLALLSAIYIFGAVMGTTVSINLYKVTLSTYPGIVYFSLAGYVGIALIIVIITYKIIDRSHYNE